MTAVELVASLEDRGVILTTNGDRLSVDAPGGLLTTAERDSLRKNKADLLAILQSRPTPDELPTHWRDTWAERAAIMEHYGGLSPERADARALVEVLREMERAKCHETKRT